MLSVPSGGVIPAFEMSVGLVTHPVPERALNEGHGVTCVIGEIPRYPALSIFRRRLKKGDQVPNLVERRCDEALGVWLG
jgi:hypothetical protein